MWLRWSALSSRLPSQQSGKLTCSSRKSFWCARAGGSCVAGQVGQRLKIPFFGLIGTLAQLLGGLASGAERNVSEAAQAQYTTFVLWGRNACEFPAIIFNPA